MDKGDYVNKFVMIYWDSEGLHQKCLTLTSFSKSRIREELLSILNNTNWEKEDEVLYCGEHFHETWLRNIVHDGYMLLYSLDEYFNIHHNCPKYMRDEGN